MGSVEIRAIPAAETRPLRHCILRPHIPVEDLVYPGDDALVTLHAGAFLHGELVGVATASRQPPPGSEDCGAWRLRGVGLLPAARGLGLGRALLEACTAHVEMHAGTLVWLNARADAVGFYERYGFSVSGEPYELPVTGLHRFMSRSVDAFGSPSS